jgi:hypothetical protein
VGYELGIAESLHLPIFVLFRGPAEERGNPRMEVVYYTTLEQARATVDAFASRVLPGNGG